MKQVNRYVLNGAQLTILMKWGNKKQIEILEQIEDDQWLEQSVELLPFDVKRYRKLLEE